MDLQTRIELLDRLGQHMLEDSSDWTAAREKATAQNPWFIPEFVELAARTIAGEFLKKDRLNNWAEQYHIPQFQPHPKTIGIVMAGNIPLVGFHDFLAAFISGHKQLIKPSSKDEVLIRHLIEKMIGWNPALKEQVEFRDLLKDADAYIATGSNNSARYFEYYFRKYPSIIRRNRTSVAVLTGKESAEQLEKLADDVYVYFGMGCRNVTKLYVPEGYDFSNLLEIFKKYNYLADHNKYKNNYDYRLALHILNGQHYMTNDSVILTEHTSPFSAISELHYEYYEAGKQPSLSSTTDELQCVIGMGHTSFGQAQHPGLCDYADGRDILQFLLSL